MNKWYLILALACLAGWTHANLTLDVSNMSTNRAKRLTAHSLLDNLTGKRVDVILNAQGPAEEIIAHVPNQGYGVIGGSPKTAALNSNEILSFIFSEKVKLNTLSVTAISEPEAVAWWIDSDNKTIITGSKNTDLGGIELDAGQALNIQAYEDGASHTSTKIYLKSLDVTVPSTPTTETLGLIL